MDSKSVHYVRVAGEVRGPIGLAQLRDMASVDVITSETEVAPRADGPWARLATLAICAEVFPARRVLGFKAAEFEELNRGTAPAMDPNEAIAQANRPPASFRGREIVVSPLGVRGTRDDEPPNEVQAMVLEVEQRVAANAPPVVLPRAPGPFPRWPWFVVPSVLGSAGILCIPLLYDRRYDEMSVSILIGWVVLFNALLIALMMIDRGLGNRASAKKAKMDKLA